MDDFEIHDKIVSITTDYVANMKKMVETYFPNLWVGCAAHKLHLIATKYLSHNYNITEKTRFVSSNFINSPKIFLELKKLFEKVS